MLALRHALLLLLLNATLPGCDECERDIDCPNTKVCSDGQCEASVCRRDDECPPDRTCEKNRCRLVTPSPPPEAADAIVITPAE